LPAHLERVIARLTSARAIGALDDRFDALIDRVASELDTARAAAGGVRGEARKALVDRLAALDGEVVDQSRGLLDPSTLAELAREADAELAPFRANMTPDAVSRARDAAIDRLVREHLHLPTIAFT
jgi:hypothetical protein